MIDTTKPWFPQDYTLDEVLATVVKIEGCSFRDHDEQIRAAEVDYHLRKGGVAGVFKKLRDDVIAEVGKPDPIGGHLVLDHTKFKEMVTAKIADAICTLEGSSIPSTRFVLMEYAVPVFNRDEPPNYSCKPTLQEKTRHATALGETIIEKYWDMVNT